MNKEYYTECNKEFYDKLVKKYKFSCHFEWDNNYKAINIDFGNKIIGGADSGGIEFYKSHEYIRKETYISNENLINLLENNNKKEVTMNKKIAIKVGESNELHEIIQRFLFSKGYEWQCGIGKNIQGRLNGCIYIHIGDSEPDKLSQGPSNCGYETYDAATQMGEIIALFNEPPVPEIIVENDSGEKFKAEFFAEYVKFGCAKIDNVVFSSLNSVMDTKIGPDSKGVTYIQIGRGKFSPDLIKQIVEHPHFGKGAK